MNKQQYEKLLNIAIENGADFAEIYDEKSTSTSYKVMDSKLDNIATKNKCGIGIRVKKDNSCYYASTNNKEFDNLVKIVNNLTKKFKVSSNTQNILLTEIVDKTKKCNLHTELSIDDKKKILLDLDKIARDTSNFVNQTSLCFLEDYKEFIICNTKGKYIKSNNIVTRFMCTVYVERDGNTESQFADYAIGDGYDFIDKIDLKSIVSKCTTTAVEKLDSIYFKGGEMPVILGNGFGAVIFHEACGHGLEATSIAPGVSVFKDDLNKKIASEKVTLIDDGTIVNEWGSSIIDDEGNETKKNILIENGVLKNYLIDEFNSEIMGMKSNGCGRRQDYIYPPTSRMSNTYLQCGTDKIDDMIKSINYGVYCERMSGGSVNPATGEFNFAVDVARLIEKGKITKMLKGVTLIGNSKEILKNVEMVSDDLKLSGGYCGSKSGMVYVTIGQPTIKISKILVGGKE